MVFANSLRLWLGNSATVFWISAICRRVRRRPEKVVDFRSAIRGSMGDSPGCSGTAYESPSACQGPRGKQRSCTETTFSATGYRKPINRLRTDTSIRMPLGRRGLRQVQDPHLGRSGLLRALPHRQGGAPRPRGGIRRPARPVCRTAGQGTLCPVQRAVAGGGALRALFAQAPRELGGIPRHPDLGPHLDGDRDRQRPRARSVRQRGRRRALPRLREARPRPGRGAVRLLTDEFLHGTALVSRRRCGPPQVRSRSGGNAEFSPSCATAFRATERRVWPETHRPFEGVRP